MGISDSGGAKWTYIYILKNLIGLVYIYEKIKRKGNFMFIPGSLCDKSVYIDDQLQYGMLQILAHNIDIGQ